MAKAALLQFSVNMKYFKHRLLFIAASEYRLVSMLYVLLSSLQLFSTVVKHRKPNFRPFLSIIIYA